MSPKIARKVSRAVRNIPNLFQGYNLYVNRDKLRLIDITFRDLFPEAKSFADLGGVWRVNAAYTIHTLKRCGAQRGVLVDTDYPDGLKEKVRKYPQLTVVEGDFGLAATAKAVGDVDVTYLFDVLLHQANPDWDDVLSLYANSTRCFVIYNQQFIRGDDAVRLTDLPFKEYVELTSDYRYELQRYVYDHKAEMHPQYNKPWGDIHNIAQWGITDRALRSTMADLGYKEVHFSNHGRFLDLPAFENHAFVFCRG
jgi:hypothetical protein